MFLLEQGKETLIFNIGFCSPFLEHSIVYFLFHSEITPYYQNKNHTLYLITSSYIEEAYLSDNLTRTKALLAQLVISSSVSKIILGKTILNFLF